MTLPAPSLLVGAQWGDTPQDHAIEFIERRLGHDTPPRGAAFLATHVFIADALTGVVIEAKPPRVCRTPLAKKPLDRCRLYHVPCRPEQATAIWSQANAAVGDWYDVPALACSLWYVTTGQTDKWYGNAHASLDCVESAVTWLRGTYRSLNTPPPYDWTPALFERRIAAMFKRTEWTPA